MSDQIGFRGAKLTEEETAAVVAVLAAASRQEKLRQADYLPLAVGCK